MRRVIKNLDSEILKKGLTYNVNGNNSNLSKELLNEQKGFCAYTETYLGRTDKKEIDHFDPNLKGKQDDNYQNWFLIKAQWNSEKSSKWEKYQPVLHPTESDFDERIVYSNGDYLLAKSDDIQAKNLIALLKLDDADLASERKKYIIRKRDEIQQYGLSAKEFFELSIENDLNSIKFLRAIQQEFNVDVYNMI
jgi:hypothetical protein